MLSIEEIMQLPVIEKPAREFDMVLLENDPSGYYEAETGMRWCCGRVDRASELCRWPDRQIGIPQRK